MRKLIVIVHASLDGFVAGINGKLDGFEAGEENLQFVCKLTQYADAALLGRVSYELLDKYWPIAKDLPKATINEVAYSKWYNSAHKIVVSQTLPPKGSPSTTIIASDISIEIAKLKEKKGKNILVFGSPTLCRLLTTHNLIDEYWIFINPVLFKEGIPLFAGIEHKIKLQLLAMQPFLNGEVALHYSVEKY